MLAGVFVVSYPLCPATSPVEEHVERARVLLADDHEDFLAVVAQLLESEFEVVKTVGNGQAAIDEADRLEPDVLVLDVSMPVLNGIEAARRLRAVGSTAKIVILTVHQDPDYVRGAFTAGAQGYVVKSRLASDLPVALREVLAGRSFVSPYPLSGTVVVTAPSLQVPYRPSYQVSPPPAPPAHRSI